VGRTEQRRAAVFICYQRDVTGAAVSELVERGTPGTEKGRWNAGDADSNGDVDLPPHFTRELVYGVDRTCDELDPLIEEHAIGWHVERIAPLERAILRVALFEILHRSDVPDEVAVDEAVETAKLYCGAEAPGFINGILGGVLKKVRHV
jgi:transcription antitermination protein NusB